MEAREQFLTVDHNTEREKVGKDRRKRPDKVSVARNRSKNSKQETRTRKGARVHNKRSKQEIKARDQSRRPKEDFAQEEYRNVWVQIIRARDMSKMLHQQKGAKYRSERR